MLLVFLILTIILLLIIFFRFEIHIKKFKYSSETKEISPDTIIIINFYIFYFIKIFRIKINRDKIVKFIKKQNLNVDFKEMKKINNKFNIKYIIKIFEVKKINLLINFGTKDALLTSIIVPIFSTIISMIYYKINEKDSYFKINPLYIDKNIFEIKLKCIISIKVVHIIYIICKIIRKRVDKNERASNRRAYAYSNE